MSGGEPNPRPRGFAGVLAKLGIALVAGALLLAVARSPELADLVSPARVEAWLIRAGPAAPLLLMGLMATAVVVSPIPSFPLDLAAGAFFGPVLGTLYSAAGALAGAAASFFLARLLGRNLVERFARGHIQLCRECSDKLLTKVVFLARPLPMVSFDLVSYAAGLTRLSPAKFLAASALGMLPATFLLNALGHTVVFDARVTLLAGATVAVLFLLLPRWIEQRNPFGLARHFRHPGDAA